MIYLIGQLKEVVCDVLLDWHELRLYISLVHKSECPNHRLDDQWTKNKEYEGILGRLMYKILGKHKVYVGSVICQG